MSATLILPVLSTGRTAPTDVGPPIPPAAPGRELRQSLPPALIEALDAISDQIAAEVFDPLLGAASVEQAARIFERVFPKFRDYYTSTLLILWGFLQEDPQRFSALTLRSFEESGNLIRASGPRWIGQEASLNALQALATITRVAKAGARLVDRKESAHLQPDASAADPWASSIVGFVMAFSAVVAALNAFAGGRDTSARLENAAALAHWSKSYAIQVYHLTKGTGILKPIHPAPAAASPSDEEDAILAEAGLDDYADALAEEDRP